MDLTEIGWEDVDWMRLAQDRGQWWPVGNMEMNLRVPHKAGNFLTSWVTDSFSRKRFFHGVSCRCARRLGQHPLRN